MCFLWCAVGLLAFQAQSETPKPLTPDEVKLCDYATHYAAESIEILASEFKNASDKSRRSMLRQRLRYLKKGGLVVPPIWPSKFKTGQFGRMEGGVTNSDVGSKNHDSFRVIQVVDDRNMIVESHANTLEMNVASSWTMRRGKAVVFWVSGFDTEGITDDSYAHLGGVFKVKGTKRYQATSGSTNTVFELTKAEVSDPEACFKRFTSKTKP